MPKFEMETSLLVRADLLASDLLRMSGVNYELAPILKMSSPEPWASKSIGEWPIDEDLFSSTILLFGFFPIDLHRFKFISVDSMGFKESSTSLFNTHWSHERVILPNGSGSKVKDVIYYKSYVGAVGFIFKPLYQSIFAHRHKRLKQKYS